MRSALQNGIIGRHTNDTISYVEKKGVCSMKRMLRILLCSLALILALSCAALAESTAMKETITVDGVIYSLSTNGTTYFVSGLEEGYAPEALVVPGSIPDPDDPTIRYKVSSVSSSALPAGVVKSITFPNTLSSFPVAVITNSAVEEVHFEAGASLSIGYRGMVNVTTIKKLYLPDTMASVGDYAFMGCANLTTVRLPITCNSWRSSPFPLTLQEVIMPEGMTYIYHGLFNTQKSLNNLVFPSTMKTIEYQAFSGCTGLTNITLNEGLTTIGSKAFSGTKLTKAVIPSTVTSMTTDCFPSSCVLYVYADSPAHTFCIENGLTYKLMPELYWEVIDEAAKTCRITGYKSIDSELTVPGQLGGYTVAEIGDHAFEGATVLTKVVIPETVAKIGEAAFKGCTSLTTANLPAGITCIGAEAFMNTRLTGTDLPAGLTELGDYAFSGTRLKSVTIPAAITEIGTGVFSGCEMNQLTIPATVTAIGEEAFKGCTYLTELTIPDTVTSLGRAAFSGCFRLESLTLPANMAVIPEEAFNGLTYLTDLTIPEGVVEIGNKSFYSLGLSALTLPSTLKIIGEEAFFAADMTELTIPEGVETIGKKAFGNCFYLTSVSLPSTLTTLGEQAFTMCEDLLSVTVPGSVTEIGNSAFSYCESLAEATLSEGVESLGRSVFSHCEKLTTVNLPSTLRSIGYAAFNDCSSLSAVELPQGLETIGDSAFNTCRALTEIVVPDSVESIGFEAFAYCSNLSSVKLPAGLTDISYSLFLHCKALTSVELPETVTGIGLMAFFGTGITGLDIPEGVTSIGESAFGNCAALTGIVIPEGVAALERSTFYGCTALSDVTLPESLESIGADAFNGCTALSSLRIPGNVTSIDETAFTGCGEIALSVKYNTAAQTFAEDNGLKHTVRDYVIGSITAPESLTVDFARSVQMEYSFAPAFDLSKAEDEKLIFTSRDPAIASVDENGLVRGEKVGETSIIIKSQADPFVNVSVPVTVVDPTASKPYPLVKMNRSGNTLTITYGVYGGTGPYKLDLICMYDLSTTTKTKVYTNGDYALFTKTLSVSSSGTKEIIANLILTDENGNEMGGQARYTVKQNTRQVGVGTPTYRVVLTSNGSYEYRAIYDSYRTETYYTDSYSNYWPIDNLIKSISVSPKSAALTPETPLQLTAATSNGKKDYIWYSSDPSVAVVSETGLVQLVGSGSATIYCHTTDGTNLRASCEVLCLEQMVESITVEALNEIDPDVRTQQMAATVLPENATLKNVEWSVRTTGEDTASIDENGLLTWHAAGDVRVIASAIDGSGVTGSVDLHWDGVPVEEIIAARSADNPMQLAWRVLPENATNPNVTFAVDSPEILEIDEIGHMTFLGDGTANVRLTAADGSGVTATIAIECFYHPEHTIVVVEEREPTCTEAGTTGGGYCSVCGDVLVPYSAIPATGHELETLLPLHATLNDDGYTHEVACMYCEHVEEESYPISCGRVILTPDGLKEIGEEAFIGVNAQQFIIEEGVETIGSRAFADCEHLVLMVMPDTLTYIADDAFEGVSYIEFVCSEGSYAEEYAIRHGIQHFPH